MLAIVMIAAVVAASLPLHTVGDSCQLTALSHGRTIELSPGALSSPYAVLAVDVRSRSSSSSSDADAGGGWREQAGCVFGRSDGSGGEYEVRVEGGPSQDDAVVVVSVSVGAAESAAEARVDVVFGWAEAWVGALFEAQVSVPPTDWSYATRVSLAPHALALAAVFDADVVFANASLVAAAAPAFVRVSSKPVVAAATYSLALPLPPPAVPPAPRNASFAFTVRLTRGPWTAIPIIPAVLLTLLIVVACCCCCLPLAALLYRRRRRRAAAASKPPPPAVSETHPAAPARRRRRSSLSRDSDATASASGSADSDISPSSSRSASRSASIVLLTEDWLSTTSESLHTSDFI